MISINNTIDQTNRLNYETAITSKKLIQNSNIFYANSLLNSTDNTVNQTKNPNFTSPAKL